MGELHPPPSLEVRFTRGETRRGWEEGEIPLGVARVAIGGIAEMTCMAIKPVVPAYPTGGSRVGRCHTAIVW